MSTQHFEMLPIPVVSSHSGADTVLEEEESYLRRACNRTPTSWHGFVFACLLLSTFLLLSLQSANGSISPAQFTDEEVLLPPPPPTTQLSSDLLNLKQELIQYYQSADVSKAFAGGDDDFIAKLANKIHYKRIVNQAFVVGLISNGQVTMKNCVEDLYMNVVNATLYKVFASLGVRLEIRQVTLQENSPFSVMHCLDTHVGQEVDLLHVSFPRVDFDFSLFAGKLVHFVTPIAERKQIDDKQGGMFDWLSLDVGIQRVFGSSSSPSSDWGAVGDGLHDYTRAGKPGVLWKNWIPGPLGHQFLADATSMLLLHALQLQANATTTSTDTHDQQGKSWCYSTHRPHYGETSNGIQVVNPAQWTLVSTAGDNNMEEPTSCDENKPEQVYFEATSSANGELVFSLTKPPKPARVYVCCCCSMLCAEEQLKRPNTVRYDWKHDGGGVITPIEPDVSTQQRNECLLVAQNLVEANELRISLLASSSTAIPVRIARVIVVY